MKRQKKLTTDDKEWRKLNKALQRFVSSRDVRSKLKKLSPNTAESEKEGGKIRTRLDQDQTGRIPGFLHEILHWYYEKETERVPYTIHENWIQSTEDELMKFLQKDKRRMNYWRKVCRKQYGK